MKNIQRTVNSEVAVAKLKVKIATLLRAEILKENLTQSDIADRMNISQARVSQILNGKGTLTSVLKMTSYLDLEPSITLKKGEENVG